jgi:hypothetical protein
MNEQSDATKKSDLKNMEEEKKCIIATENFEMKSVWI